MKLKTAGASVLAFALFMTANANANALFDLYAGATVGAGAQTLFAHDENKTDSAQSYGAVIGIDIPLLRFELEYDYLNSKDVQLHLGMINGYLKMPTAIIQPYLGVGIGSIFDGSLDIPDIAVEKVLAYQGMLGLTFDIPVLPIKIDAEARALYAPDFYKIGDNQPDMLHYDLRLKLRYVF